MHSWYQLLEGYSYGFVRAILDKFAPSSRRVLDPFCGTGTTALEACRMGKEGLYCEINPVLQFLIKVKAQALVMDDQSRKSISDALRELASNYKGHLSSVSEDRRLESSYNSTFGDSKFFFEESFKKVLRARVVIDELYYTDPILADFLTIATLASLIPASSLKRAGDLRFRNPKELRKMRPLESSVRSKLIEIANDISRLKQVNSAKPLLICEDARKLGLIPPLKIDAVVTSPPYVNGTNYFRNTKVELWFLRCLHSPGDLRRFRTKTVTSGINSVQSSARARARVNCPELRDVVEELEGNAYDRRIPILVESYFADLNEIFGGLDAHMCNGGLLAVDIGDSIYAGVHVPVDRILVSVLEEKGYSKEDEILLRKRQSHDGSPLRQVLLILRKTTSSVHYGNKPKKWWNGNWIDFKENLPHQNETFSKRNWGHPLHSLCSYQGKMKPSLAHHLVRIFAPNGGKMLDPFAGVGTIPFEGALHGVKSFGFEISPAAKIIASAKVARPERTKCLEMIRSLKRYINSSTPSSQDLTTARAFGFNHKLSEYYHPDTLKEIVLARKYFQENEPSNPSEYLVMACLLHILHGNRPYALSRRSHPITPFAPTGPYEYRPLIPRLMDKVNRSLVLQYPPSFVEGKIFFQDSTSWWPREVDELDAIVTSPPFFDSTRFYLANWLRLWFCGWEKEDFRNKPRRFIDERQKSGFSVYGSIFRQARERLKQGGVMVLHLGGSKKCDMARELSEIASRWFVVADIFEESVEHCESHGIRDKGTVKKHQYLVLI